MSKFRATHRTVVTEIKSFIIDTVSRTGAFRQTVSARVPDLGTLSNQDVNVSDQKGFIIHDPEAVVALLSPEPVRLVFVQDKPLIPPEEHEPVPVHTEAEIEVGASFVVGQDMPIQVTDSDLPESIGSVEATVYNVNTGETDTVSLFRSDTGPFSGHIPTVETALGGVDFDDLLHVKHNHRLRVIYEERKEDGSKVQIEKEVVALSPFTDSVLSVSEIAFPGKPIGIHVEDVDRTGSGTILATVDNEETGEREIVQLSETESGQFVGRVSTQLRDQINVPIVDDGILTIKEGDSVRVSVPDHQSATNEPVTMVIPVIENYSTLAQITGPAQTLIGESITFKVTDFAEMGENQLLIPVENTRTRERIIVPVFETFPLSGVFEGELLVGPIGAYNILRAEVGDILQASYIGQAMPPSNVALETFFGTVVVGPPVGQTPDVPTELPPLDPDTRRVEMVVDGMFFLNGSFPGKIHIFGLRNELTRCSLLSV